MGANVNLPPMLRRMFERIDKRLYNLERRRLPPLPPAGDVVAVMVAKLAGSVAPTGSGDVVLYTCDFTLPTDALVLVDAACTLTNLFDAAGPWSGEASLQLDGAGDGLATQWFIATSTPSDQLPIALQTSLASMPAGSHVVTVSVNCTLPDGRSGSTGLTGNVHLVAYAPDTPYTFDDIEGGGSGA